MFYFWGWILFDNAWQPGVYKWGKIIYLFPMSMSWMGSMPIAAYKYSLPMISWGNDHA